MVWLFAYVNMLCSLCLCVIDTNGLYVLMAAGKPYQNLNIITRRMLERFPNTFVRVDDERLTSLLDEDKVKSLELYAGAVGVKTVSTSNKFVAGWMVGSILTVMDINSEEIAGRRFVVVFGLLLNHDEHANKNVNRWVVCYEVGKDEEKVLYLIPAENVRTVTPPPTLQDVPRSVLRMHKEIADLKKFNKSAQQDEASREVWGRMCCLEVV